MIVDQDYERVPIEKLTVHPDNPRRGDLDVIAESVRANGFYGAVVAQRSTGRILAGNHRLMAAQREGFTELPVMWVDVDDDVAKRILLVDNRTNDLADYDGESLVRLLRELEATDTGLIGTGYSADDLAGLVDTDDDAGAVTESEPPPPPVDPVTVAGDVWQLGAHRVICGDCRDASVVDVLLGDARPNIAFTSPPYASQRAYDESSGFEPIPPDKYAEWFSSVADNVAQHLAADGSWFVNIRAHSEGGQRSLYVHDLVAAHVRAWGWLFVDDLCWVNTHNGVPGGWPNRFKNAWEPVYHFSRDKNIKFCPLGNATPSDLAFEYDGGHPKSATGSGFLGTSKGRQWHEGMARPSNVLQIAAAAGEAGGIHSAPFPVALPAWFIRSYSDHGDSIYDPFMGSGTTLIAAEQLDRTAFGCEISPAYCDVIAHRWQKETGQMPLRNGAPHDFLTE